MNPEIIQSILLDEWYIVTRKSQKEGYTLAHQKYPIPKETLEQIAYDFLFKSMDGMKKGYTFKLENKKTNEQFKVTVERISE